MQTWTIIEYIGHQHPWEPLTDIQLLENLKTALKENILDPTFEKYGNFIEHSSEIHWIDKNYPKTRPTENFVQFFGNFFDLSRCFRLETNDKNLITELTTLIRANQQTQAYKKARYERTGQDENYKKSLTGF